MLIFIVIEIAEEGGVDRIVNAFDSYDAARADYPDESSHDVVSVNLNLTQEEEE